MYCMNTRESHRHWTAVDQQHFNIDFLMQGKLAFDKSLQVYGRINIERHDVTESSALIGDVLTIVVRNGGLATSLKQGCVIAPAL